jgi:YesN/AraC family two-component response regulator
VIVSAYGDMKNIRKAMNLGAFDFITKPIDLDDLEITVDKTLKHLALLREALRSRDQLVALHQELDLARQLQQSILPRRSPESLAYELHAAAVPAIMTAVSTDHDHPVSGQASSATARPTGSPSCAGRFSERAIVAARLRVMISLRGPLRI